MMNILTSSSLPAGLPGRRGRARGVLAQNILGKILDEYYPMEILYPESEERVMNNEVNSLSNKRNSNYYQVFPNPSSDLIYISKRDDSLLKNCTFQLTDISSRLIQSISIDDWTNL